MVSPAVAFFGIPALSVWPRLRSPPSGAPGASGAAAVRCRGTPYVLTQGPRPALRTVRRALCAPVIVD